MRGDVVAPRWPSYTISSAFTLFYFAQVSIAGGDTAIVSPGWIAVYEQIANANTLPIQPILFLVFVNVTWVRCEESGLVRKKKRLIC